jgi:hypothetical protein
VCLLLEKGHAGVYGYGLTWLYAMAETVAEISQERAARYEDQT